MDTLSKNNEGILFSFTGKHFCETFFSDDSEKIVKNIGPMVVGFSASCITSVLLLLLIIKMLLDKGEQGEVEDTSDYGIIWQNTM